MTTMQGKVCLVTGANSGIGKETARELARLGATVVMVARSAERGEAARREILAETTNTAVDLMLADLSSQAEVERLAQAFKARYDRLHVLVNNAGAIFAQRQESVDGIEMTFALNHMGYFWLTNALLDVLKASAPARIINVSSDAHKVGRFNFDDYQRTQRYSNFQVYGESKLANVLHAFYLAEQLAGSGVTINAMHPGFVATGFGRNNGALWRAALAVIGRFFALKPAQGADTVVYLATSPEVEGVTGQYFAKRRPTPAAKAAYDKAAQRRLWELSEQLSQRAAQPSAA